MNIYGELLLAQLENVTSDPGTGLVAGRLVYRSDNGKVKFYNAVAAAWQDLNPTIGETAFTVANNQVAAANVTGLLVSSATYRGAIVEYDIYRKTDTASTEVRAIGRMTLLYRTETSTWEMQTLDEWGDSHGVTLTITAGGQVQYTSTSISGANYVGKMNFRARTFNV